MKNNIAFELFGSPIEMDTLRRQMDHLLSEISGDHALTLPWSQVPIELNDAGDKLELKAQIPGINPDDLDITVNRDSVTVSGEWHYSNKEQKSYGSEFLYGKFSRTISLPVAIQQNHVEADYTNGVLTLHLPKLEQIKNQQVKIKLDKSSQQAIAEPNQ